MDRIDGSGQVYMPEVKTPPAPPVGKGNVTVVEAKSYIKRAKAIAGKQANIPGMALKDRLVVQVMLKKLYLVVVKPSNSQDSAEKAGSVKGSRSGTSNKTVHPEQKQAKHGRKKTAGKESSRRAKQESEKAAATDTLTKSEKPEKSRKKRRPAPPPPAKASSASKSQKQHSIPAQPASAGPLPDEKSPASFSARDIASIRVPSEKVREADFKLLVRQYTSGAETLTPDQASQLGHELSEACQQKGVRDFTKDSDFQAMVNRHVEPETKPAEKPGSSVGKGADIEHRVSVPSGTGLDETSGKGASTVGQAETRQVDEPVAEVKTIELDPQRLKKTQKRAKARAKVLDKARPLSAAEELMKQSLSGTRKPQSELRAELARKFAEQEANKLIQDVIDEVKPTRLRPGITAQVTGILSAYEQFNNSDSDEELMSRRSNLQAAINMGVANAMRGSGQGASVANQHPFDIFRDMTGVTIHREALEKGAIDTSEIDTFAAEVHAAKSAILNEKLEELMIQKHAQFRAKKQSPDFEHVWVRVQNEITPRINRQMKVVLESKIADKPHKKEKLEQEFIGRLGNRMTVCRNAFEQAWQAASQKAKT